MTLRQTGYLTGAFGLETERKIDATHPGMAHFAGSGLGGRSCRECKFFQHDDRRYAAKGVYGGKLKPAPCKKFREMMRGEWGPPIPPEASACKYFEQAERVPSLFPSGRAS